MKSFNTILVNRAKETKTENLPKEEFPVFEKVIKEPEKQLDEVDENQIKEGFED
ncbi:MAG: hypothetical protein WC188_02300 [Candidatus Caldatribacteriota bacterium]